jgi:hypothetical protein
MVRAQPNSSSLSRSPLNSLGVGIVDNRKLPGAQPVEGAAKAIVDVIENPRSVSIALTESCRSGTR